MVTVISTLVIMVCLILIALSLASIANTLYSILQELKNK